MLQSIWQIFRRYRRYQRSVLAFLLAFLLTIVLNPLSATAFNWADLLIQGVQVIQLSNISDRDEVELGKQINQQVLQEVRLSRDPAANELVKTIGQQLVPYSDRTNFPWTFQVIDDKNINAFATMGGFVYVNTGTIAAADNRAQLAGVIGHEMGHITGRHALEQLKQQALTQGIVSAVGADRDILVGLGSEIALRLPRSREDEFDADRRGLKTITQAGFAPQALPAFMQKLAKSSGAMPEFLSTHPGAPERVKALNEQIEQNKLYGNGGLNDTNYQKRWRSYFRG
jgi:beta-barrel assembly-enhancing protease